MEKGIMMPLIRMAKVVIVVAMFWPAVAGATDFITTNSGDWFDPAVWSPTPYPFDGDNATISNNYVGVAFYNTLDLQLNDLNLVNGGLSVNNYVGNLASLSLAGTNSYWTNGSLNSYGTYGRLNGVVTQLGTLRLMGTNILGGDLINRGTMRQTDAGALLLMDGAIVNPLGGVYDFAGDGSIIGSISLGGWVTNEGTLLKSSGVNTSTITSWFVNQGGVIEVDSGTLAIQSADPNFISSDGTFIVGAGATLDPTGGSSAYWRGKITGSGAGQVVLRRGSLNASSTLTLNFPDGLFQWTGGLMNGVLTNLGVITLSGANGVRLNELVNVGLFRHTNTAALSSSLFENLAGGIYDVEGNGQFNNGTFENLGLFRKSSGAGVFSMNPVYFYNYGGTVEVDSGTLEFPSSNFLQTNGVTRLAGGNLSGGTLNFIGGILTGVGSVTGTVVSAATVIPGNGGLGVLQIVGNYQQNNGGALDIALGGTNTGQFGQLLVSGRFSGSTLLAGTLNLSPTNNFTPAIGDQFQILSCSNLSGTFSLPPTFPTGMEIAYSNNGVFLTVTNVVNWPAQLNSPMMGNGNFDFGFKTVSGQSYTVQTNDDLTSANWGDFTNVIGDGSPVQFAVPATNVPIRFFRLREP